MWALFPPLRMRVAPIAGLFLLILRNTTLHAESSGIEWSLTTPSPEAGPKSFPALAIHAQNRSGSAETLHLHIDAGPLRCLSGADLNVELQPGEGKALLHTLYVPPGTPGGSEIRISARSNDGLDQIVHLSVTPAPNGKATIVGSERRFIHPGEKASYQFKITNTGNVPLHCTIQSTTSPATARAMVASQTLIVPIGETMDTAIKVETGDDLTDFTEVVTTAQIDIAELHGDFARQFLYFHTEAFPLPVLPDKTLLFETLKGSITVGIGGGNGNEHRGTDVLAHEELTLEGLIAENTRLQLTQAFVHPSGENGIESSALSALPGITGRSFFHLGIFNPYFDLEAGEVTTEPARLLSTRETGDGGRVAVRPNGKENLQIEAFAEENTLTITRKDVFGATVSGALSDSPLEFWRVGSLSKRGDIGPQGSDWDAAGLDTGWKIPIAIPLRAELSVAAGKNNEHQSGAAWLAGLHYNRTRPGEDDESPLKAGIEFASGDRNFPGAQNGRDDQRAYVSFRFSANPTYVQAYADYNNSEYKVVPVSEKTLAEEEDVRPDFLLTSQSRLIDAGIRWKNANLGAWHLPSGSAEVQETSYFNKSDFFDKTKEHALAINLAPFDQTAPSNWNLNLLVRGGTETHESDTIAASDSRFLTLGTDVNFSRPAPPILEKLGGPGQINAEFSTRYTQNFDDDRQALNRTGVSVTAAGSWKAESWRARAGVSFYDYVHQEFSDRVWVDVSRRVGKDWWAGIQAAQIHRGDARVIGEPNNESAVLLTFRHDFAVAVPWLPTRGQVTGRVFDDINNNGRQDPDEPGLEGVKVAVGSSKALTSPDGRFSFSPMTSGNYPVVMTSPEDLHYEQSTGHPIEKTVLNKGGITQLAIGLIKPTACEGIVRLVRETSEAKSASDEQSVDLSSLEIIATDSAGRTQRGTVRADGFFAIYLAPGNYKLSIDPATLKPEQNVTPAKITLKVERNRIENLTFTITERTKRVRKTFSAKGP
jgi:hypothetical protein